MTSMDEDHRRDMEEQKEIANARVAIETFLQQGPTRIHRFTREALQNAAEQLREDEMRTVRRWN